VTTWHLLSTFPLRALAAVGRRLDVEDENRGASLVEYALLVAFIALVCVAAVTLLGASVAPEYSSVADGLD
jgi:pilus assembly protein Flp/PilA